MEEKSFENPSPQARCTGHCCKRFAIEHSLEELGADYQRWKKDPATSVIPDVETISQMVIPIESLVNSVVFNRRSSAVVENNSIVFNSAAAPVENGYKEHVYSCRNLQPSGDCGIYERRPQMCRDFPEPKQGDNGGCHFWKCESSASAYYGQNILQKLWTRWKWLKKLNQQVRKAAK